MRNASNEGARANFSQADIKILEHNTRGAVAESNLANTFISYPSGIFGLFHALPSAPIALYTALVVGILILLWINSVLGGKSMREIVDQPFVSRWARRGAFKFSIVSVIDFLIYGLNGIIILTSVTVYILQRLLV
jgi:hypothetical protein